MWPTILVLTVHPVSHARCEVAGPALYDAEKPTFMGSREALPAMRTGIVEYSNGGKRGFAPAPAELPNAYFIGVFLFDKVVDYSRCRTRSST